VSVAGILPFFNVSDYYSVEEISCHYSATTSQSVLDNQIADDDKSLQSILKSHMSEKIKSQGLIVS
jgi:hypothetical protein